MSTRCVILFVVCIVVSITSFYADTVRPIGKRIHSYSTHSDNGWGSSIDTSQLYYYNSDTSAWADSISVETEQLSPADRVITYENIRLSNINVSESLIHREYLRYNAGSTQPTKKYVIETDRNSKILAWSLYNYANNQFNFYSGWIYFYDLSGRIDYLQSDLATYYHYKYAFTYNDNSTLAIVTQYELVGNAWYPLNRKLLNYNSDVVPFINPLQMLSFRALSLTTGLETNIIVFDLHHPVQSVLGQTYNGAGGWVYANDGYSYHSNATSSGATLHFYYSSGESSSGGSFYFDLQGLYLHRSSSGSSGTSTEWVTWEDYTPIQDEYYTPILFKLSAYPNPFTNYLIINAKDNSFENISIYNIKGQLVRTWKDVKSNELTWDGKDESNQPVSNGVYLIKAKQDKQVSVMKVIKL